MARTLVQPSRFLPGGTDGLPNVTKLATGVAIRAGDSATAGDEGRVYDLAMAANLAYATTCADTIWAQSWYGTQFTSALASPQTQRCIIRTESISSQHTTVRCSVYASSPSATGVITFRGVNAGTNVAIPILAPFAWYSGTLSVAGGFGPGYEEIALDTTDDVTVESVSVRWLPADASGLWPGAAGALAAGALETGVYAMDDTEIDPDYPYSAAWLAKMEAMLTHINGRKRPVLAASAVASLSAFDVGIICHQMPYLSDNSRSMRARAYAGPSAAGPYRLHVSGAARGGLSFQRSVTGVGNQAPEGTSIYRLGEGAGNALAFAAAGWKADTLSAPLTNYLPGVEPAIPVATNLAWMSGSDAAGALLVESISLTEV